MPRLKFLRGARRDLHDAFKWYRERGDELASDFANEVDVGLIQIRSDPASGHIYDEPPLRAAEAFSVRHLLSGCRIRHHDRRGFAYRA